MAEGGNLDADPLRHIEDGLAGRSGNFSAVQSDGNGHVAPPVRQAREEAKVFDRRPCIELF